MTDTVYVTSCNGNQKYHTDQGCPRLESASMVREVALEQAEWNRDLCQYCAGEVDTDPSQSDGHLESLRRAADGRGESA